MDLELLKKIRRQWDLGTLECEPMPLKGGLMHRMYSLFTSKRRYAVKLLNPYVMMRDTAQDNYRTAERLERILEAHNIPILPALTFGGSKMQEIDGRYFYLYDWYEGKALKSVEIREEHCAKIGKLLADIHGIDRREIPQQNREVYIDWDGYIEKLAAANQELYELIAPNRDLLYDSQTKGNIAIKQLPAVSAICHNDIDSKNVLWKGTDCRIIDLECLSYANPFQELYEVALCWSGFEIGSINIDSFGKLIQSYSLAGGECPENWEILYDSNYGRLEWLEYNIKRALGIECSAEEIETGISQVRDTIAHVVYYHEIREDILHYGIHSK